MAPFAIRPCSIRDAAEIAANNMEAFWTDPVFVFSRRGQTLDQTTAQKVLRAPKQLITERHRRRHLKVVDEQSQALVGYARWILPEIEGVADLWGEAKVPAATEEEERRADEQFGFSKWTIVGQASDAEDPITDAGDRLLKDKDYIILDMLAVRPHSRSKGIGTMLVESGIQQAEHLGRDIFVHAKKAALGLYIRLGFEVVEKVVEEDIEFGGKAEQVAYFLTRLSGVS